MKLSFEPSTHLSKVALAALFQVTPHTIDQMRKIGRIPFVRIGKTFRYDPVAVTRALKPGKERRKTKCWVCGGNARRRKFKAVDGQHPAMIAVRQCDTCGQIRVSAQTKKPQPPPEVQGLLGQNSRTVIMIG